ncbi:unnamed protein product [Caretta caretta]
MSLKINNIQELQSQPVTVICLQAKGECGGLSQPSGTSGLALNKVQHTRSSASFFSCPPPPFATPPITKEEVLREVSVSLSQWKHTQTSL